MRFSHAFPCALATLCVLFGPVRAIGQGLPDPVPALLDLEVDTPFTHISGLARLPDDKWVVTDSEERRIVVLDPATGDGVDVGRHGQGPREFLRPFAPMRMPGGHVWIYDSGNRRFLELDAEGEPRRTHAWPESAELPGRSPPHGVDVAGGLYWEATPPFRGSVPTGGWVVRWQPGEQAVLRRAEILVRDAEGRKILAPFVTRDGWAVDAGGRIGILRTGIPRVEWIGSDDTFISGPRLDVEPAPIDEAELAAADEAAPAGRARMGGGGNGESTERALRDAGWITPDHLPAFYPDRVFSGPAGTLWAQRRLPLDEPYSVLWVFDDRGRVAERIRVGERVALLGVSEEAFYAVHTDDLGLQRIRRYRIGDSHPPH